MISGGEFLTGLIVGVVVLCGRTPGIGAADCVCDGGVSNFSLMVRSSVPDPSDPSE